MPSKTARKARIGILLIDVRYLVVRLARQTKGNQLFFAA
jgi:hypothetical protein